MVYELQLSKAVVVCLLVRSSVEKDKREKRPTFSSLGS